MWYVVWRWSARLSRLFFCTPASVTGGLSTRIKIQAAVTANERVVTVQSRVSISRRSIVIVYVLSRVDGESSADDIQSRQ